LVRLSGRDPSLGDTIIEDKMIFRLSERGEGRKELEAQANWYSSGILVRGHSDERKWKIDDEVEESLELHKHGDQAT